MAGDLGIIHLGRMPYGEALSLQRDLAARRIARTVDHDVMLLVEHPPVITLGRGFQAQHLSTTPEALDRKSVV